MKLGLAALVVGIPLLAFGVFVVRGGEVTVTAYWAGFVLLSLGVARLLWAGWRGSRASWLLGAPAAGLLAWTLYERVRQTPPYPPISVLGADTAPILSAGVAVGLVLAGWLRLRSRDTHPR